MLKQLLLHGPGKIASRIKLTEFKKKFDPDSVLVFAEESSNNDILASIQSMSMFGEERTIILENPDINIDLAAGFEWVNMIVWFDRDVSKSVLYQQFQSNKKEIYYFSEKQEITVFPFLDLLGNQNKQAFVEIEKLKKEGFEIYYFLTMAFYLLRNLTVMPNKLSAFQLQKLEKQRKNFSSNQLLMIYKHLLELEYKLKSGLISTKQAEFLLVKEFMGRSID